jgi:hypothetical protein
MRSNTEDMAVVFVVVTNIVLPTSPIIAMTYSSILLLLFSYRWGRN